MVTLNRPQIPEHLWVVPPAWRPTLIDLHHQLTAADPHHRVTQVATRKGRVRIHIVPSVPFDENDELCASMHNLMWTYVHRAESAILANDQGDIMSTFLEEVHTELHNLWQSMENKSTQFAQLFKGVTDKVAAQVETEAKAAAPEIEKDAETAVADVEKTVEADAPAVEAAVKTAAETAAADAASIVK